MTKLRIVYENLDTLIPNPDNPKDHSLSALRESFDRFGVAESIVIDDRTGMISAGHGRRLVLLSKREDGDPAPPEVDVRKGEWWVPVQRGWASKDDDEAMRAMIAFNRTTELGGWHDNSLALTLQRLAEVEGGLIGTGFTPVDLEHLLGAAFKIEPSSTGTLLALSDVSIGEPKHSVAEGEVWKIDDRHVLVVADVMTGWQTWVRYLEDGSLFVPYPGPYAALSEKADSIAMVLVQPDTYVAGHILDKFIAVKGEDRVRLVS